MKAARNNRYPLAVFLILHASGCRRATHESESAAEARHVRCAPVVAENIQDKVSLRGTVAPLPDRFAQIAPQISGRVVRVLVREGDRVTVGQELARVDDAVVQDQARQTEAQLAKASAETKLAETTETRVRRIFDHGIAARQELDDAQTKTATARAGEAEARATLEIAQRQIARASVRSPLAGVVLKILRRPGELVDGTPATPVLEVGDPSKLELVATATAAEIVAARIDMIAQIDFPALPGRRFSGQVSAVAPAVDRTTGLGTVRVGIKLDGVSLPVGIGGTATISSGHSRKAFLVPAAAVRAPAGREGEIVLCGSDGHAHVERIITANVDGRIEITPAETSATGETAESDSTDGGTSLPWAGGSVVIEPVLGVADGDSIVVAP